MTRSVIGGSVEHEERSSTPRGVPRRAVLRTAAWSTPVVLAAAAAPAMAASVGPLTVTATKSLLILQLRLSFSGGQANLPVTVINVSTTFLGVAYTIAMAPTTVSSVNGSSSGGILSTLLLGTQNYIVSYSFNGQTYTTVVSA